VRWKQVAVAEEAEATGEFVAKVSDFELDRQGERFAPRSFDKAVAALREAGSRSRSSTATTSAAPWRCSAW
jgi:hypothetical protein